MLERKTVALKVLKGFDCGDDDNGDDGDNDDGINDDDGDTQLGSSDRLN